MSLAQSEQSVSGQLPQETGWAFSRNQRILMLLPLLLVGGLFAVSPNYQTSTGERTNPLGGDFLQEWTAGKILASAHSQDLYDIAHFRAVQHDESLVGFKWSETKYFPPVYPPFYYLLMSPFSWLSFSVAIKVWAILSALFLVVAAELLLRYYPPMKKVFGPALLLAMIFAPLWVCFNLGHKSTLILLILTATFLLLRHGRPIMGGAVFGLMLFKPHLAIVIGLTMLFKRQWRFVGGAAAMVGSLTLVSLSCGLQVNLDFVKVCLGGGDYISTGGYQLAEAHCLWGAIAYLVGGSGWWANGLTVLASAGVIWILGRILSGPLNVRTNRFELQFASLVIATILLSPHLYFYDLVIALLPLLLVVGCASRKEAAITQNQRVFLQLLVGTFLIGAGMFINIAGATYVQPSVVLLLIMLVVIMLVLMGPFIDSLKSKSGSLTEQQTRTATV